jgi:uncharacterized membrane protein YphA (DoxX/SURF4 family)
VLLPALASAHEAYVLDQDFFWDALGNPGTNPLVALADPANARTFLVIAICIGLVFLAAFVFGHTLTAARARAWLARRAAWGKLALRVAVGTALIIGALHGYFLGTEIPFETLGSPAFLQLTAFLAGTLLVSGVLAEGGAVLGIVLWAVAAGRYGTYMMSYATYVGAFIALLLWGGGMFSWNPWRRSKKKPAAGLETAMIRVGYGTALLWAAVSVKLLHPILPLTVVTNYHLTRFSFLFPQDPLLVTLGATVAELIIGLFILLGFQTRLIIGISLFYITLSLFYFGEAIWPHLILYGASCYLLAAPQRFSLDAWLSRHAHH